MLLTLSGWTSPRIAEAFGVREDTVPEPGTLPIFAAALAGLGFLLRRRA